MQYHELKATKDKTPKRVGRGISAGQGKTAGRGTKGQSSRTGGRRKPGFEGGQTPLMMRLPKLRGFKSKKQQTQNVYTGQLNNLKGTVDNFSLFEAGIITTPFVNVKVVTKGELSNKVSVNLQGATASALASITAAGGTFNKVVKPARQPKEEKTTK
jgi:large subunit ribosomal protein L15